MKKKFRLIIISLIILLFLCLIFFLVFNKSDKEELKPVNLSAKSIIDRYEKVTYGKPQKLKGNIITNSGSYTLTGRYECITINSVGNVQLNLDNAEIYCNRGPAIYVEDSNLVNIHLDGENLLDSFTTIDLEGAIFTRDNIIFTGDGTLIIHSNHDGIVSKDSLMIRSGIYKITSEENAIKGRDNVSIEEGQFEIEANQDGIKATNEEKAKKGFVVIDNGTFNIISKSDAIQAQTNLIINDGVFNITTNGNANVISGKALKGVNLVQIKDGKFNIKSNDDSIHSDNQILIIDGDLTVKSFDDAIHADGILQINDGSITIDAKEGLESTNIIIKDGNIIINTSENGITAGNRNPRYQEGIEIHGGNITINMGEGETCGIDSSDSIRITGGNIEINGKTPFFYTGTATNKGGTIVLNGKKTSKIPEMETVERTTQGPEGQGPGQQGGPQAPTPPTGPDDPNATPVGPNGETPPSPPQRPTQ